MIYLTGVSTQYDRPIAREKGLGVMAQPGNALTKHLSAYPYWAVDNGCYAKGETFRLDLFYRFLCKNAPHRDSCLFAVAPDVVGNHAATVARSLPVLPVLRAMGYPAAFVAQDGATPATVPWDAFDVLFIGGGPSGWKWGYPALALAVEANRRGVWVHMGRVNTKSGMVAAQAMGCHSVDGTGMAWHPRIVLDRILEWTAQAERQPALTWR